MLEMKFRGSLIADFKGRFVSFKRNSIKVFFANETQGDLLMQYRGNFVLESVTGRDINKKKITLKIKNINDEIQHISEDWNNIKNKYEDFNKSNRYMGSHASTISYTRNGKKIYKDINNRVIPEKEVPISHYRKLKRFRRDYVR